MNIIIQSPGFKCSESLETFIREKINSIKETNIIRAIVTLFKGPPQNSDSDYCEIKLEVPGNDYFVKKHTPYFETAVSECVDILSQKIHKGKNKRGSRNQSVDVYNKFSQTDGMDIDDLLT